MLEHQPSCGGQDDRAAIPGKLTGVVLCWQLFLDRSSVCRTVFGIETRRHLDTCSRSGAFIGRAGGVRCEQPDWRLGVSWVFSLVWWIPFCVLALTTSVGALVWQQHHRGRTSRYGCFWGLALLVNGVSYKPVFHIAISNSCGHFLISKNTASWLVFATGGIYANIFVCKTPFGQSLDMRFVLNICLDAAFLGCKPVVHQGGCSLWRDLVVTFVSPWVPEYHFHDAAGKPFIANPFSGAGVSCRDELSSSYFGSQTSGVVYLSYSHSLPFFQVPFVVSVEMRLDTDHINVKKLFQTYCQDC